MTYVSSYPKCRRIEDIFVDFWSATTFHGLAEEHGYLGLPRESEEEPDASCSSDNSEILGLRLSIRRLGRG